MEKASFLKINPADSVVVCLRAMKAGETVSADGKVITLLQDVPAGHKVLIEDKNEGEDIIKYGYPIGHAKKNLKAGEWVNENNLKTGKAAGQFIEVMACEGGCITGPSTHNDIVSGRRQLAQELLKRKESYETMYR